MIDLELGFEVLGLYDAINYDVIIMYGNKTEEQFTCETNILLFKLFNIRLKVSTLGLV